MNNSAAKVGEIFREAGTAFTKLSEMTMMLQPTDDATPGSKWSEEEVEMLRGCVNRFAVELNKISQHIKNRTMRPQKRLLEMDTGLICDVSHSPPRQYQLVPQLIQHKSLYEWEQQAEISNPLQHDQPKKICLKHKKHKNDEVADLLRFDPGIVPLTPPAKIMEEDTNSQQAPSEFDNEDICEETFSRPIIKSLCVLDPKSKAFGDSPENTCSIGTLHAASVPDQETDIEGFYINNRSIVTKEEKFTFSQAAKTSQIRTTLKKKAFEDAGIPIPTRQVSSTVTSPKKPAPHVVPVSRAAPVPRLAPVALSAIHPPPLPPPTALGQNAEVTLNMLNASENEDVDGLGSDVKLEFESTNDEVAT